MELTQEVAIRVLRNKSSPMWLKEFVTEQITMVSVEKSIKDSVARGDREEAETFLALVKWKYPNNNKVKELSRFLWSYMTEEEFYGT